MPTQNSREINALEIATSPETLKSRVESAKIG
jgi:hypothetical protein